MPPIYGFKKKESEVVDKVGSRLRGAGGAIGTFLRRVVQKGRQRFTVMFIPHSEKKIFNVQISVFTLLFVLLFCSVLLAAFIGFSTHFSAANRELVSTRQELRVSETSLLGYRDEIGVLGRQVREYQATMDEILSIIDSDWSRVDRSAVGGDLSSLVRVEQYQDSSARDLRQLTSLTEYFRAAEEPLGDLRRYLATVRELIHQIPTGWPVQGKRGWVTQRFGPAMHPLYPGMLYMHKGIDIAWAHGTEILATADGEVSYIENNPAQYGLNLIIRHQYGYSTRYAHLSGITVQAGQKVRRGQVIGYLGNTGLSVGDHLHYEVIIAGQVVDPQMYLDLSDYDGGGSREPGIASGR